MIFRQLFEKQSSTYTYLLADSTSRAAVLIDPVLTEMEAYLRLLQELDLRLVMALDTHVHADHITALGALREATGCSSLMGQQAQTDCVSARFCDGQVLRFGSQELQVLYTPGHTDDSYSFYWAQQGMVFTGDTLLIRELAAPIFKTAMRRSNTTVCLISYCAYLSRLWCTQPMITKAGL